MSAGKRGTKRKLEDGEEDDENFRSRHRESIFKISMCKLNRYRQIPDPSLRRSVLICNTLRFIENEMEREGLHTVAVAAGFLPSIQTDNMTLDPLPIQSINNNNNSLHPLCSSISSSPLPIIGLETSTQVTLALEVQSQQIMQPSAGELRPTIMEVYPSSIVVGKNLTELDSSSGRATPYPSLDSETCRNDSGALWNDSEDRLSSINWSTVLNFSSQSELDYGVSVVSSTMTTTTTTCTFVTTPSSSPNASSDSFGSSSGGSEIFGDIDLSLYDFDLLPLSPPNVRLAPLSAEELLRTFPNNNNEGISSVPANGCFKNEFLSDELDNIMHILVGM